MTTTPIFFSNFLNSTRFFPKLMRHIFQCRRYYKRPLRGPYGQMLEAEMKKPENDRKYQLTDDLKFLEELAPSATSLLSSSSVGAGDPRPKFVLRTRGVSEHSLDEGSKGRQPPPPTPIKRKVSADNVVVAKSVADSEPRLTVCHQRTTSSPSKLEGFASAEVSVELLEQLLRGSSEQLATENSQKSANVSSSGKSVQYWNVLGVKLLGVFLYLGI